MLSSIFSIPSILIALGPKSKQDNLSQLGEMPQPEGQNADKSSLAVVEEENDDNGSHSSNQQMESPNEIQNEEDVDHTQSEGIDHGEEKYSANNIEYD